MIFLWSFPQADVSSILQDCLLAFVVIHQIRKAPQNDVLNRVTRRPLFPGHVHSLSGTSGAGIDLWGLYLSGKDPVSTIITIFMDSQRSGILLSGEDADKGDGPCHTVPPPHPTPQQYTCGGCSWHSHGSEKAAGVRGSKETKEKQRDNAVPLIADALTKMAELQQSYNQQGFLSPLSVLNEMELREAREAFAKLEDEFGKEYTQYSLHNVHLQYPWVMSLTKHPRILQVIQAVLGPDVLLLDSRFICKYPILKPANILENEGSPTKSDGENGLPYIAWHQDMRYWGIAGGPVLSVWLALDDSQKENGVLQVIPGSHFSGMLPHRQATRSGNMLSVNQEIPEELVQVEETVFCPLKDGQMSIHDGFLVHASDPNTSRRRRCGFVIRYVPTCANPIQDPDRPRKFHATMLACGEDQFNHFSNKSS
ncbi:L-threonyl-[L-threonyl-carrier protein] 4-chlorinase-like [Nothobranchius furzeri]|uniref:L-threonyl-[L-threonyl-carrier protein] 4-chlorinase-like n=1 Tax=Nothobranchius furzeri TaxID=105023 RepID=UPI003904AC53